jgi:1-acyl-sn-glycerol-3-phosphate acyltransferase
MNYQDFVDELKTTGRYLTPAELRPAAARRFPLWASLKFHVGDFRVVLWQSRLGKAGKLDHAKWADGSYAMKEVTEAAGGEIQIEGYQNILDLGSPVVYIGNHMSLLETFLLPGLLLPAGPVSFVVKQALMTYPVFGHVMRATHPIAVGRQNPRDDLKQVLTQGQACIKDGQSVVIFPQSTRSTEFSPRHFNSLGAKLAVRAEVPIVPVAIKTDFLANGRFVKDLGRVHPERRVCISFGEALREGTAKEQHQRCLDFITAKLREWGGGVAE